MFCVLPATFKPVASCEKLLQKEGSSSTFCNKICTCCTFYRPKANLFCSKLRDSRVWRDSRVILSNNKSVLAQHAATFNCFKTGLNGGVKKRNTAFQHVLRQFCKKSFTSRFTVALKVCSRAVCQMTEMHEYMKAVMAKHWSVVRTFLIVHWPKINQGYVNAICLSVR